MRKILSLTFLFLGLLFISLGTYSYFSSNVTGVIITSADDFVLNVTVFDEPITKNYTLKEDGYLMPGDSGEFNIDITVESTDAVYLTVDFDKQNIPSNLNFYLDSNHTILLNKYFKVLDTDKKDEKITVFWHWDGDRSDEADNEFIGKKINGTFTVNALQLKYGYVKNGAFSKEAFWSDEYKDKIRTVSFAFDTNLTSVCSSTNLCFDITLDDSPNKVFAYLIDNGYKDVSGNILYDLKIASEGFIIAPSDLSYFFSDFANLISIDFKILITTNVTDMSYLFNNCESLEILNLNSLCTDNVKDMKFMFNNCKSLKQLDLSSFNTNKVIYMNSMFKNNSSLTNLNISNFVSNRAIDINGMFYGTSSLEILDMRNFVFGADLTSNIDNYTNLFTLANSNLKIVVKNAQEQAFILGLGSSIRPIVWNTNNVVLN